MANANQCSLFLKAKPYLGVIVKTQDSRLVLAIGPYFGSGHKNIVQNLVGQRHLSVHGLVWAGELLLSKTDQKLTLYRANETSGYLHELNENPDLRSSLSSQNPSLNTDPVHIIPSDVAFLDYFKDHRDFSFSSSYQPENYNPEELHILSDLNLRDENFRHGLGNEMSAALTWISLLGHGRPITEVQIASSKVSLRKLKTIVTTYLRWQNHETLDTHTNDNLKLFLDRAEVFLVTPYADLANNSEMLLKLEAVTLAAYKLLTRAKVKPVLYQFEVEIKD